MISILYKTSVDFRNRVADPMELVKNHILF